VEFNTHIHSTKTKLESLQETVTQALSPEAKPGPQPTAASLTPKTLGVLAPTLGVGRGRLWTELHPISHSEAEGMCA
jgi:hypothetical protein